VLPAVQMRHPARRRTWFRCRTAQPQRSDSPRNLRLFLRKPCGLVFQPDSSLRRLLTTPSLPYASNRLRTLHDHHPTSPSDRQQRPDPGRPWLTVNPCVHGWPSHFPASGIQSPYIHRPSGLAQIAVSTVLRASSIGNRRFLRAEHCRYGTRDNAPTKERNRKSLLTRCGISLFEG
jgi:hypothetical protein